MLHVTSVRTPFGKTHPGRTPPQHIELFLGIKQTTLFWCFGGWIEAAGLQLEICVRVCEQIAWKQTGNTATQHEMPGRRTPKVVFCVCITNTSCNIMIQLSKYTMCDRDAWAQALKHPKTEPALQNAIAGSSFLLSVREVEAKTQLKDAMSLRNLTAVCAPQCISLDSHCVPPRTVLWDAIDNVACACSAIVVADGSNEG